MNLNYKGLSTFHSVYNYQTQDFIDASDIAYQGNWSLGVHENAIFRTFLNVKYYIVKVIQIFRTAIHNEGVPKS